MFLIKDGNLKIYNKVLLENVNVEIKDSCIYRIVGENGSGKTVFINSLLGLETNFKASIYVKRVASKDVIYIPDTPFFLDNETVSDVLKTLHWIYEIPICDINKILIHLKFNGSINQKISQLSHGTINKLCIVPLFINRRLYVLDEIFTGLDSDIKDLIFKRIDVIAKSNATIIYVDHSEENSKRISLYKPIEVLKCQNLNVTNISF